MSEKTTHRETTERTDRVGETCDCCGTQRRVIEKLPDKPLSSTFLDALEESGSFAFARGIAMTDASLFEIDSESPVTEDVVLSTETATRVLERHEGVGWVVSQEFFHEPHEEAQTVGFEIWTEASNRIAMRLHEMME